MVLASNTSSIPIATLGEASGRPEHVVGMHFFNPVPVMSAGRAHPVRRRRARPRTSSPARVAAEVLGKTTVRSSDEAGFIVNRLLIPYLYDAIRLYERGFATREDIDTAIHLGLGHPMGPLALADLIGLDTVLSIGEVLRGAFGGERYEAPADAHASSSRRAAWAASPAAGSTTPDRGRAGADPRRTRPSSPRR